MAFPGGGRLCLAWVGRVVGPSRGCRSPSSCLSCKSSDALQPQRYFSLDTLASGRERRAEQISATARTLFVQSTQYFRRPFHTTLSMSKPSTSICRQNYHEECEANVNKQINMELYASYVYMSMAYYFDREDVALPGFHKFFKKQSDEEREHAEKFMKYQNKRGGRIVLQPVAKPTRDEWTSPLEAVTAALELEKTVNQTLLELHGVSSRNGDPQLCDFLETEFLEEQVKSINELSGFITQLNRAGKGLGEYIFDKELQEA